MVLALCYAGGQLSVARLKHGASVLRARETLTSIRSFALEQVDIFQVGIHSPSGPHTLYDAWCPDNTRFER